MKLRNCILIAIGLIFIEIILIVFYVTTDNDDLKLGIFFFQGFPGVFGVSMLYVAYKESGNTVKT